MTKHKNERKQIEKLVKKQELKIAELDKEVQKDLRSQKKTLADRKKEINSQVIDLVNSIIFGVVLVVIVLLFFLGFKNALFVGIAIPMSMFMSIAILSAMGNTLNTMILFGLILGLGMLVDNGIVVDRNTIHHEERIVIGERSLAPDCNLRGRPYPGSALTDGHPSHLSSQVIHKVG